MTATTDLVERSAPADTRIRELSQQFGQRIVALVQTATVTVTDAASCQAAVALRSTIGALQREIQAGFEESKAYYYNKHKEVCAEENKLLAQLIDPRNARNPNTLDGKLCLAIQQFTEAEDRRRRELEQQEAERRRRDAEERAAAEAAVAEKNHQPELAAAIIEEAIAAPMPTVSYGNIRSEVAGLKTRREWRWRFVGGPNKVKDILRETPPAVLAKAMTRLPREYLQPDVRTIDKYVEAMQEKANIPGIEVYSADVPVRR